MDLLLYHSKKKKKVFLVNVCLVVCVQFTDNFKAVGK